MSKHQEENEKVRFKGKKEGKKATVATWSDSDSSESKSEGEEMTNLCFVARENFEEG